MGRAWVSYSVTLIWPSVPSTKACGLIAAASQKSTRRRLPALQGLGGPSSTRANTRAQQTTTRGPYPTCCLCLDSPKAKNGFYIFKRLKAKSKGYFLTYENYMKFKCQCSLIKLYWNTPQPFTWCCRCLQLLLCYRGRAE